MPTARTAARAPARSQQDRPSRPRRSRPLQLAVVAGAVVLLGVAALIFFLQGEGEDKEPKPAPKAISGTVQLTLGGIQNANAGVPASLPDDAANQIMQALATYVDQGLVMPAKTGKPGPDLSGLFDAGTAAAITGPDKAVLFEGAQPELTGDFKPFATPVIITALSDGNGQFVLATAALRYSTEAVVKDGVLATSREIAMTFSSESGQWKITGYDVTVSRQGPGVAVPAASAQQ